ncbi:NAD(P)/FAD-dependent oxidoreductase [Sphingomonas sp. CFBP 13728]|uniref:NAD(P)/FAD-dependent oxidoreductase n=1 Tax=Sphingomonas sp. CFBP 13728 TaxID=2775294 RepID=UPI0031595E5B
MKRKQVVIVGAGFGGLAAAKALSGRDVTVTLIDRTNHHLFQPLLYQVATAALAPSDIATATRTLMAGHGNVTTLLDDVTDVDDTKREVLTASGERIPYDYLVLATGCSYSFFGNDAWAEHAPVLKTLADALSIRERLLDAFERAERSVDASEIASLLTFVVVGGGPTGVEMAGAIAELAKTALARDFRNIDSRTLRIKLVEAGTTILSTFPDDLPRYAAAALTRLGVEVILGAPVLLIDAEGLQVGDTRIDAATVIWAAGTRANEAATWLDADAARNGALRVLPDCSVEDRPHVFAIGDVASFTGSDGKPLPGLAPVAKQQGRYVGDLIWSKVQGRRTSAPFQYRNWGSMAVIGRSHAVADFGTIRLRGFVAWLSWSLVHLMLLVDFRSRLTVYVNWAWSWFTRGRGVRLLTRATHLPTAKTASASNLIPEGHI